MEYQIYTGAIIEIKKGFLKGTFKIMYCGMPNKDTFALSPYITHGYQGFSPNIYFNKDASIAQILDVGFKVIEVTPEYIVLGE